MERLSTGCLAAASRKLWSSTATPGAVSTALLLAQGLHPYSCSSLVIALMAGAAGTAQIPQDFAARATPRQTLGWGQLEALLLLRGKAFGEQ